MNKRLAEGRRFLHDQGFNLFAVVDTQTMPETVLQPLREAGIDPSTYQRTILIGAAGLTLWEQLRAYGFKPENPIDQFSLKTGEKFLHDFLGCEKWLTIFPSSIPLPLQQLGMLAGWSQPSPLGLSIHPQYGTWFAYRSVFLVDNDVPVTTPDKSRSPCDACIDTPCVSACPVNAVQAGQALKLDSCLNHRLAESSVCATRCLARLACPVGKEYRYTEEQLAYHGNVSLNSLIRYRAGSD